MMKRLLLVTALFGALCAGALADKFTVTVDDQDALDAMNAEIARIATATGGKPMSVDAYASDFVTTQHRIMREPQLRAAAMAKVEDDPDWKAYRDKKAAAAKAEVEAAAEAAKVDAPK